MHFNEDLEGDACVAERVSVKCSRLQKARPLFLVDDPPPSGAIL